MSSSAVEKLHRLEAIFQEMDRVLVAYSGGIDSTLIARVAYGVLGDRVLAATAVSPSLLPDDLEDAKTQAVEMGVPHRLVTTHEMENPNYTSNPTNRCYFCKSELYDTLKPLAQTWGYSYIVDGVNADDLHDYRPGIQAAKERGTRSPLAEVGITKLEVREIARYLDLPWWDKPAQPCLSSRFPYGESITLEKLRRVGQAERYLRNLGWKTLRVRSEGEVARIELPAERIVEFVQQTPLETLVQQFQAYGFVYVTLDLEGFRSGKLNQTLSTKMSGQNA
jgi:pyridinium-3,5-biscarboxylic acid mononucleotide sulfurtransferase